MGLFNIFKKKEGTAKIPKGFYVVHLKDKVRLTEDSVKLMFDIPDAMRSIFHFTPGQYVNIAAVIDGNDIRRSYSICSGPDEVLAIGVKRTENGLFSNFALDKLQVGDEMLLSVPMGNFKWNKDAKRIVAFAAGSGITPILSIAKAANHAHQNFDLYYGNRTVESTMFRDELKALENIHEFDYFTREKVDGAFEGRLTPDNLHVILKSDLSLLSADDFYACGPQDMVENVQRILGEFGVAKEKIHTELFKVQEEAPKATADGKYKGTVHVKVIQDGDVMEFDMDSKDNLLQECINHGIDAPYSCRGGVCQTCRCKVVEGTVNMRLNFTLSEEEVKQGYILNCQSYPTSPNVTITFDE